jgi:tetratricopeptide (TPR) repeat protein
MRLSNLFMTVSIAALLCLSPAQAQEMHTHQHDTSEKLGRVNFIVSCKPSAQSQFNRATALLHSFWYGEAEKAYLGVARSDPGCAMAYWGVAMSLYHPEWAPATTEELQKGRVVVEKANSIGGKTQREKDYIAAIEAFYKDSDKLSHPVRALAYEKAMEHMYTSYPKDHEAAIFYALSLLGTAATTSDKTYKKQKLAAAILNKILPAEPQHPGVTHYLIHSFDYPQLAQLALPAARRYAKIAPSSPHALHMPSHIFTRLGLWQESIQSNLASAAAAQKHVAMSRPGAASFDQLHALDYLVYAYLQGAQDAEAKRILDQVNALNKLDQEVFQAAYAWAAIPARYAIERRRWSEAARLELHPANFPWEKYRYAEAIIYFARALGAARSNNPAAARGDVEKLSTIQHELTEANEKYWAEQVEIQREAATAWLLHAEGKDEAALSQMRSAAALEAATEKRPVTPGPITPARELLGDMLIELNQPQQALQEFAASLQDSPNRFNGLFGAARAAEQLGDKKTAGDYYAKLVALTAKADSDRPEIRQSKEFLAQKSPLAP